MMKAVCVFAGARSGRLPAYAEAARELGTDIANRGLGLVYGGGSIGLMGHAANGALGCGGSVLGVIPRALATSEVMHTGLTELVVVENMHERKAMMAARSDAFVALPGGLGTLEELFEVVTWAQLGFIHKPVGLLNVAGYFDPLLLLIDHAVQEGFIAEQHRELLVVASTPKELMGALLARSLLIGTDRFSAALT